ncbi:MAG TPA: hypothetical protein VGX23_01320 [Actinocrinis sp.]|nr:hypothetical protein [Actinocrinis sp.]
MRLSQSEFATAVRHAGASLGEPNECTKRLVQKWESGEHSAIRPNYRRALQAVTRIPYEQLGFLGAPTAPVVPIAQVLETATSVMPRTPPVRGLPQSGVEGDRLRYALTRPGYADEDSVALIEAHTSQLFVLEHTRAARLLAPQVAMHLDEVASVLAGARRSVLRQKLASTGGRSAALAGWLAFDCGDVQGAHRWWDNALAAAQVAADSPLLACTLTYLSCSAADRGDPTTAWQLANTALGHAGSNPRAKAWMAARAAQEAATMGERYAAQVALELSLELGAGFSAADLLRDQVEQPWAGSFDLVCLYAMAAGTYGRLGELRQSRELVAQALKAMRMPQLGEADGRRAGDRAGDSAGDGGPEQSDGRGGERGGGRVGEPGREDGGDPGYGSPGDPGGDPADLADAAGASDFPDMAALLGAAGLPGAAGYPGAYASPVSYAGLRAQGAVSPEESGDLFGSEQGPFPGSGEEGASAHSVSSAQFTAGAGPSSGSDEWYGNPQGAGLFGPDGEPYEGYGLPDPLDLVGRAIPDQGNAQVKSRSMALAEIAYAATRIGELDLARESGRLANDLAGRLEVSQAKRRLRALAPLLAESRRGR